jgi:hypothetical protein
MIKLIEWILGAARAGDLDEENRQACEDVEISRAVRAQAEVLGPMQRLRLERNHVGEGFRLAFEAGQTHRHKEK